MEEKQTCKEDAGRETHFGLENPVVGAGHADYGCVRNFGDDHDTADKTDAKTDVCKT